VDNFAANGATHPALLGAIPNSWKYEKIRKVKKEKF
jgi:hypothetical protein